MRWIISACRAPTGPSRRTEALRQLDARDRSWPDAAPLCSTPPRNAGQYPGPTSSQWSGGRHRALRHRSAALRSVSITSEAANVNNERDPGSSGPTPQPGPRTRPVRLDGRFDAREKIHHHTKVPTSSDRNGSVGFGRAGSEKDELSLQSQRRKPLVRSASTGDRRRHPGICGSSGAAFLPVSEFGCLSPN